MSTDSLSVQPSRPLRWRWVFLGLLVLALGATQVCRLYYQSAVRRELGALRQAGYPVSARELEAGLPALADKQNGANGILDAIEYLALGQDAFNQKYWPEPDAPLSAEAKAHFKALLADNEGAQEALHAATRLGQSRFPIDYARGPNALLPHLAKIKSLSHLLKADVFLRSEDNQIDEAVESVLDGIALARSLDGEPLLISQLVRQACLAIACSGLERLVGQHSLPDLKLAQLESAVRAARQASTAAFQGGFKGELCLGTYFFQSNPSALMNEFQSENQDSQWLGVLFPIYAWSGLKDRDFLFYLRTMHQILDAAASPFPNRLKQARLIGQSTEQILQPRKLMFISRALLPALDRSVEKGSESEARLACTDLALRIERFRAQSRGTLPSALSELAASAPEFPKDPIDGAPLRYLRLEPGYVVYSIGADGKDDGGRERLPKTKGSSSGRQEPNGRGFDVTFAVRR